MEFINFYTQLNEIHDTRNSRVSVALIIHEETMDSRTSSLVKSLEKIYGVEIKKVEELEHLPKNVDYPWFTPYDVIIGVNSLEVRKLLEYFNWPKKWKTGKGLKQIRGLILDDSYGFFPSEEDGFAYRGWDMLYVSNTLSAEIIQERKIGNTHIIETYGSDYLDYVQSNIKEFEEWTKEINVLKGGEIKVEILDGSFIATILHRKGETKVLEFSKEEAYKLYTLSCLSISLSIPDSHIIPIIETCSNLTPETRILKNINNDERLMILMEERRGRDYGDYAEGISRGISEVMCLGVGDFEIEIGVEEDGGGLVIEFISDSFKVGRDGGWCLNIKTVRKGWENVNCVWQDGLKLFLKFEELEGCGEVEVQVEVKGNVYANVIEKVEVGKFKVKGGGVEERGEWWERREVETEVGGLVERWECEDYDEL